MVDRGQEAAPDLKKVYEQVLASHGISFLSIRGDSKLGTRSLIDLPQTPTQQYTYSLHPHTHEMVWAPGERGEGESYLAQFGKGDMGTHPPNLETGQSQAVISAMKSLRHKVKLLEEQRDRERAAAESMRRAASDAVINAREQVDACRSELEASELKITREREALVQTREKLFQETQMMTAEIEARRQELYSSRQDIQYMKEHIERTSAVSVELTSRVRTTFEQLNKMNDESQDRVSAVAEAQEQLQADLEHTELEIAQLQSAIDREKLTRSNVIAERETAEVTLARLVKLNDDLMKKVGHVAAYCERPPEVIVHEKPPRLGKKKKKKPAATPSPVDFDRPLWHL